MRAYAYIYTYVAIKKIFSICISTQYENENMQDIYIYTSDENKEKKKIQSNFDAFFINIYIYTSSK